MRILMMCTVMSVVATAADAQRTLRLPVPAVPDSSAQSSCGALHARGTPSVQVYPASTASPAASGAQLVIQVRQGWSPFAPIDSAGIELVSISNNRVVIAGPWRTPPTGSITTGLLPAGALRLRVHHRNYRMHLYPLQLRPGMRDTVVVTLRAEEICLKDMLRRPSRAGCITCASPASANTLR